MAKGGSRPKKRRPERSGRRDVPISAKPVEDNTERHGGNRIFDLLIQPRIDPAASLATDELHRLSLASSTDRSRGMLRLFAFPGDYLSLGRFHVVPVDTPTTALPRLHRRHSGGRNVAFGRGFIGLSLLLPHRSALVADEPLALKPTQVLNRCVRGILAGLKTVGIPAFYPGRDWVTVDRRVIGMISMDVGPEGGLVFEAVIAISSDFRTEIGNQPQSQLAAKMPHLEEDAVTTVARELGVDLDVAEVAEIMVRGYKEQLGVSFTTIDDDRALISEVERLAQNDFAHRRWVLGRRVDPTSAHLGVVDSLLGTFEAYVSLSATGQLDRVLLSGDVIANPSAISELETRLKGCPPDRRSIDDIAAQVLSRPENFILGIPDSSVVSATIMKALSKAPRKGPGWS